MARRLKKSVTFFCFFFAVFSFYDGSAYAARFSGEYLLRVCALDENGVELVKGGKIACQAYISAIIDYHNFLRSVDSANERTFCVPEEKTLNEIQLEVLLYFMKNKKLHRKFVAAPGVELALSTAYPCHKKRKSKG